TTAPPLLSALVTDTPRYGWLTFWPFFSVFATCWTRLPGMAKPTPMLPSFWPDVAIAVLMPMTCPLTSTSAPPELPGLMAGSVFGSVPVTLALADRPSEKFTWTVPPAPTSATTWLLVTMYPLASKMTPDPSPVRLRMSTTLGFTAAAMSASEERSITFTAVGP